MILEFVQTEAYMWPDTYIIRGSRRTEVAGQTIIVPPIIMKFVANMYEELVMDVDQLAEEWAIQAIAEGAGSDTLEQKADFTNYVKRAVRESVGRLREWKTGIIREYIPFDQKMEMEHTATAKSIPLHILEKQVAEAYKARGFELKKSRPRSDANPNKFGGGPQTDPKNPEFPVDPNAPTETGTSAVDMDALDILSQENQENETLGNPGA